MKKTPVAARFIRQLIKVNDQVCFSALSRWEFDRALAPIMTSEPSAFTTDAFPENPFADSTYRKISELSAFSLDAEQVALRMGVIAGVEYILAYIEDVQALRHSLAGGEGTDIVNDAPEEQLRLRIEKWSGALPVSGYFRTVGYLRHLRNHYAHVNDDPGPAFRAYVRSHGTSLNKFWDNGVTDVHGVDFRTLAIVALTADLSFGIMNIMRVLLLHIDDMIADTLSLPHKIQYVLQEIRSAPNSGRFTIKRLVSKARGRLNSEWGVGETEVVLPEEIQRILGDES